LHPQRLHLPAGLAAEEYYAQLLRMPQLGVEQGDGHGEHHRDDRGGLGKTGAEGTLPAAAIETIDEHSLWQDSDRTPLTLSEQVVRQMVQAAWKKSPDETGGDLQPLIDAFLAPPVIPWQQILRQFIGTAGRVGKAATWKRVHRRFGQTTPGIRKQQYLNLVVAVDVSDSTDTQPLREAFAAELLQIARARNSRITLIYVGSRIQKIDRFSGTPAVVEVFRGGGFTDLRPAFAFARTLQPRPAAIIYLTDGYGPAPDASAIPTLWVLPPEGKKPVDWGLELRLATPTEEP
jgi:predicted metal-dependent peptidase